MFETAFTNKNILFVYSGAGSDIFAQQNVVFISKFIEKIKQNNQNVNFFVLTITDTLYLALDDDVKIIKDRINKVNLLKTIKSNNVNVVIPIYGDKVVDNIFKKKSFIESLKDINIIFSQFYLEKQNQKYYSNIAKKVGFKIKRGKVLRQEKDYKTFSFLAIKDSFNNQILLDIITTAKINGKSLFLSSCLDYFLTKKQEDNIILKIRHFGELLNIRNIPYKINITIDEKGKVLFDKIEYGYSYELLFSLQRQKIDISNICYKIISNFPFYHKIINNFIAYSYEYENRYTINFATDLNDIQSYNFDIANSTITNIKMIKLFNKNKSINYNRMATKIIKKNDRSDISCSFLTSKNDIIFNTSKIDTKSEYVLVFFDDYRINSLNYQIVFLQFCKKLQKIEKDKHFILVSKYMIPIMDLVSFKNIHIYNNITPNIVKCIVDYYKIENVFLNADQNVNSIISILREKKVCIYGLNYDDELFFNQSVEYLIGFFNKLGIKYKNDISNDDYLFEVYCISGSSGNQQFLQLITSRKYYDTFSIDCLYYPVIYPNFEVQEKISNAMEKIFHNIKSTGLIKITFAYKDGELYVVDISNIKTFEMFLILQGIINKNTILDICSKCITNKNIELTIRNFDKVLNTQLFYQKIIFALLNNTTLTLEDEIVDKIFNRFVKLTNFNAFN